MSPPLCGEELETQLYTALHGVCLSPKQPGQYRRDLSVSAALWGGAGSPIVHGTPTWCEYPPYGPGRTGGARVSLPLCGKELEDQPCPTPATGRPYLPNGPGRTGGTRVYAPLLGEQLEVQSYATTPHGASLSPKRPTHYRRDAGVSAAVWGGARNPFVHSTPRGVPIPQKGPGKTGGSPVYLPLCGEELKVQSQPTYPRGLPMPETAQAGME